MRGPSLIFKDILVCIQFLSRLPVPERFADHDKPDFTRATRMFPLAGLLIALPAVLLIAVCNALRMPEMLGAALAVALQIAVTGALHEDGLCDCIDGFGGGRDSDSKLEIMKDSRVGAFGLVAAVMALILRVVLIASFLHISPAAAIAAFLSAQMLSRAFQVYFWRKLAPARKDGLAYGFGEPSRLASATAMTLGIGGALFLTLPLFQTVSVALALIGASAALTLFGLLCKHQIGGHTGDTIGALQIVAEIVFLAFLTTFPA